MGLAGARKFSLAFRPPEVPPISGLMPRPTSVPGLKNRMSVLGPQSVQETPSPENFSGPGSVALMLRITTVYARRQGTMRPVTPLHGKGGELRQDSPLLCEKVHVVDPKIASTGVCPTRAHCEQCPWLCYVSGGAPSRLPGSMRNAKRTHTSLQNSPTTGSTPTPSFSRLLDGASHWGVVGRHQLPIFIPYSACNGWQQHTPSLPSPCCLCCHYLMRHGCGFLQQAVPHLKLGAAYCVPQWMVPYMSIVQLGPVFR